MEEIIFFILGYMASSLIRLIKGLMLFRKMNKEEKMEILSMAERQIKWKK